MNTQKIIRDVSNSMQDAVKLGNVKRPQRENKEVKVEKNFLFIERYKNKKR
nr:hypothetical protein [Bacillus luti]